jgi:Domain of unknown function DUF29
MVSKEHEYDKDFYAWTVHNAQCLREGKLSEVDLAHVAEEIESMGKSDKRELMSRLAILLAHLLKWQFQPERRGNSWKCTIEEQRFELIDLLEESPCLKYELDQRLEHAYQKAVLIAMKETGINKEIFPQQCLFSLDQSLSADFFPE